MTYFEAKIDFLQNRIYKLKEENKKLRDEITSLEKEFYELKWRKDCEIMRSENK